MTQALMIIPVAIGAGAMQATNVTEEDHPEWDAAAVYQTGERVILAARHQIYESLADENSGFAPEGADLSAQYWVATGSTNRWRAFDATLGLVTSWPEAITYRIGLPARVDAVAFIGLVAVSLQLVIRDSGGGVVYDRTANLLDTGAIQSWLDFFTYEDSFDPEQIFADLGALSGFTLEITIANPGGTASVSEIVMGRGELLGEVLEGSKSGFTDYSRREVDDFGNISIVKRATARKAEWQLSFEATANRRIQRALEQARGAPAYFYPGDDMTPFALAVYGVADDFFPALSGGGHTIATLSLTGVA
ncbi:hypothetical protein RPE78_09655 [Thioclava litoralis]|uniref:Carbohydrate binding domain-containing protein n=1 Tax=Thioclava litoralis TaxID=3076557 RepID=A0ABZ1DZT3_9RHOB|nr:hypothetical protein RPE78_09655 [Thioclava sp. FTW29]